MTRWLTVHRRACAVVTALLLALASASYSATSARAEEAATPDPARLAAAQEVLDLAGSVEDMRTAMTAMKVAMVAQMRQSNPQMAEAFSLLMDKLLAEDNPRVVTYMKEVREVLLAFYASRFSLEELEAMKAFYSTAAGKKVLAVAPEIPAAIAGPLLKFQQGLQQDLMQEMMQKEQPKP